jgi:hypothetical protein
MSPSWADSGPLNADALDAADLSNGLNDELRARVKGELDPGERLLWAGWSFPPPAHAGVATFVVGAVALVLLGIGIIGFAHTMSRTRARPEEGSMLIGYLGCIVGSFMAVGLIGGTYGRHRARRRETNVSYAVTDRRILMWKPEEYSDGIRIDTLQGPQIQGISRIQRPDGSGDLESYGVQLLEGSHWNYPGPAFKHIPEVRRVEQIIRNNLMRDEKATREEREPSESRGEVTW